MTDTQSDFVDEIVQDELPRHVEPPRDDFKPWHKVRKQFIRERQWNKLVSELIQRLRQPLQKDPTHWSVAHERDVKIGGESEIPEAILIDQPLRCLMLPGDDLLDLRSLWKDIRPERCWIRYLGFNESHGSADETTRVYISNNEVTSLERVATDSQVLSDRFQSIANQQSQAYSYLKDYGPYHVVNLDLCDSLFPTTTSARNEYYNALHRLAEFQMKMQTTPWLLFITTQVEPHVVSSSEMEQLCRPTRQNYDSHHEFLQRLNGIIPPSAFGTREMAVDISQLSEDQLLLVFGVALGKWLMQLAGSASPQWFIDVKPCYRYRILEDPRVEMLSLAFLFRPNFQPPVDTTGLSSLQIEPREPPDELQRALRLISVMEHLEDVDELLESDEQLRKSMENASADLLVSAGYDRVKYLQWADRYHG